jgi:hypothetical protein
MQEAEALKLNDEWALALDAAAGEAQVQERQRQREIRRQELRITGLDLDERSRRRFEAHMADRRKARAFGWTGVALISAASFGLGVLLAGLLR